MSTYRWQRIVALVPLFAVLAAAIPFGSKTVLANHTPAPTSVTIAGSLQSELGCPGDWQPECTTTRLVYDAADDLWQGTFTVPAQNGETAWEYKAALNGNWNENYGKNAAPGGANVTLSTPTATTVKFFYDHKTHWVTDNRNSVIATVAGSFQSEIGCPGDWQPNCLRSMLQDPDGDGTYTLTVNIPEGNYESKVAINESWDENYGQNGAPNGANIPFSVPAGGKDVFFSYNPVSHVLTISVEGAPKGNLATAAAHWVSRDTIVWKTPKGTDSVVLHYSPTGDLMLTPTGVDTGTGGVSWTLTKDTMGFSAALKEKFPHLDPDPMRNTGFVAYKVPQAAVNRVRELLKGEIAVSAYNADKELLNATALQIPGVLDDLYTYNGKLGVSFQGTAPVVQVWAPTAKSVKLHLFNDANPETTSTVYPMTADTETGVWSISGRADWNGKYYLFEVEVFVRGTGQVERNIVTDPYSLNLSLNSSRSQIVNLDDPSLKPAGWNNITKPRLDAPEDIVLYELHVRDFSVNDPRVPEAERGTFKAFTRTSSYGMTHLRELAIAGMTHIHLLPAFDCASINENKAEWQTPDPALLSTYAPNSEQQAEAVEAVADLDGFNWCYDPYHFTAPEGSFSTNPNGTTRILEFREMVQALSQTGLRVVMDVVYNHTAQSGQGEKSVLDKVVPGYYHRLNADTGAVETSTCCQNTATEHNMMEKLMIDSLVTWARDYKVDSFRFDLMGHHMKRNLEKARNTLQSLTLAKDGVDGSKIYIYGEGWNFGEVANNARGVNAVQFNMAGTGIGTFNDRIRDAVRGGGPFDSGEDLKTQGFASGLFYDPNDLAKETPEQQLQRLLLNQDQIRVGLAGNLRDYQFVDRTGAFRRGSQVDYNGSPTGYVLDPQETINYVEAHDNQTLFDAIQTKLPLDATMEERVRAHNMGMSVVALAQGVPFFQAGQDMLRSKSLDRNSYNSGDWFNKLDFTYQSNNWGVGLPPGENDSSWDTLRPLLGNPALKPTSADIVRGVEHFRDLLRIRKSSELFRLETADEINARLRFHNTGPDQVPGLIVMSLSDLYGTDIDPRFELIVVVFNASDETQEITEPALAGMSMQLHPVLQRSKDQVVRDSKFTSASGTLSVPARTTAVFVARGIYQQHMPVVRLGQ